MMNILIQKRARGEASTRAPYSSWKLFYRRAAIPSHIFKASEGFCTYGSTRGVLIPSTRYTPLLRYHHSPVRTSNQSCRISSLTAQRQHSFARMEYHRETDDNFSRSVSSKALAQ